MLKEKVLNELKNFWNDEDAQGMMEYILLAVLVIGAVTLAKGPITDAISGAGQKMNDGVSNFDGNL